MLGQQKEISRLLAKNRGLQKASLNVREEYEERVVELKTELERIREQVQNVE